ncbi:MAG: DUF4388 domain-containing protein [Myxococcota bacterium]
MKVSLSAVVQLLEFVENLGDRSTGVLSVEGPESGRLLIERGRICWAVSGCMQRRLAQLLCEHADLTPAKLDTIVNRCRASRAPFGEYLVNSGLISEEAFREVLLKHTTEALGRLGSGEPSSFVPHRHERYDARFTYAPGELLASVGAAIMPEAHKLGRMELEQTLDVDGRGAAFAEGAGRPVPVAIRGPVSAVGEVNQLGSWATRMARAALQADAAADLIWATTAKGTTAFVWRRHGLVCVGTASDARAFARAMVRLRQAS